MGVVWDAVSEGRASLGDGGKAGSVEELLAVTDCDIVGLSRGALTAGSISDDAVGALRDHSRALYPTPSVVSISSTRAAVLQVAEVGGGSCRCPGEAGNSVTEGPIS